MPEQVIERTPTSALSFMDKAHRSLHERPSRQSDPQTQIDILTVHEITLIKTLQLLPDRRRKHQTCGIHPIHPFFAVPQRPTLPKSNRRGKRPLAVLHLSIHIQLLRIRTPHPRLRGAIDQRSKRISCQADVRIEHAHTVFASVRESPIVVFAEAKRMRVAANLQQERPGGMRFRGQIDGFPRQVQRHDHPIDGLTAEFLQIIDQIYNALTMAVADNGHCQPSWNCYLGIHRVRIVLVTDSACVIFLIPAKTWALVIIRV